MQRNKLQCCETFSNASLVLCILWVGFHIVFCVRSLVCRMVCASVGLVSLCSTSSPVETRLTVYRRPSITFIFFVSVIFSLVFERIIIIFRMSDFLRCASLMNAWFDFPLIVFQIFKNKNKKSFQVFP